MLQKKYLITLGGPTAIGKTNIAIQLALHYHTVIISADSRQIYKELNIGVAKPSNEQLALVKHYFISHISIHQDYTAYDFQKEVHQLLHQLFQHHDVVIMTGGTGFYINAVLYGLNEIPAISTQTKDYLKKLYEEQGIEFLQNELKQKDPAYYLKADLNNPIRLLRALEVIYETQRPFSAFLNDQNKNKPDYFIPINLWLNTNREILHQRINERVNLMIELGLEEEAKSLYPYRHLKSLNTVGYKEWWRYFDKPLVSKERIIEEIKKNTRQYAKRQITWFKHQWEAKEIKIQNIDDTPQNVDTILNWINKEKTIHLI